MLQFKTCYRISLNFIKLCQQQAAKDRALILHHGMLGSARNLRPLCKTPQLMDLVDILLVDARNHGESPFLPSHSVQDLAKDLYQFSLSQSRHYKKLTLLGHSMGGLAVMELTKQYPQAQQFVERVIIVDIPCNPQQSKGSWSQEGQLKMLQEANKIDLSNNTSQILRQIQKISLDSDYANLIKFNVKIFPNGTHKWKVNLPIIIKHYQQMTTYSLKECKWSGPVEVIYGSQSSYFEQEQIQHFIKQYPQMDKRNNFHRIQGAGHWVHFDKKQQFLNTVQRILLRNRQV